MKSIVKLVMLSVLSTAMITSVYAGVVCKAHTAKGKVWMGKAETRSEASEMAMSKCMHHAKNGKKCVIKSCKTIVERHHPAVEHHHEAVKHEQLSMNWQCTSMNSHFERFVAMGVSANQAGEQAVQYCKAQSPYDTNCAMLGCVYRVRN